MLQENEFDYYLIFPSFKVAGTPILMNDDDADPRGTSFLYKGKFAENVKTPVHLKFNPPVPPKPKMVDHLSCDHSVFSKKVYDILSPLAVKGLQLVPVLITGNKGEQYDNYWVANIYNEIECFDREKSVYNYSDFLECWERIEKLVIDKEKLSKIPLEERLIFVSQESVMFKLYHKSLVDVIMSVNPEGLSFMPVERWGQGAQFEK